MNFAENEKWPTNRRWRAGPAYEPGGSCDGGVSAGHGCGSLYRVCKSKKVVKRPGGLVPLIVVEIFPEAKSGPESESAYPILLLYCYPIDTPTRMPPYVPTLYCYPIPVYLPYTATTVYLCATLYLSPYTAICILPSTVQALVTPVSEGILATLRSVRV